jgi:hypothetical protein
MTSLSIERQLLYLDSTQAGNIIGSIPNIPANGFYKIYGRSVSKSVIKRVARHFRRKGYRATGFINPSGEAALVVLRKVSIWTRLGNLLEKVGRNLNYD